MLVITDRFLSFFSESGVGIAYNQKGGMVGPATWTDGIHLSSPPIVTYHQRTLEFLATLTAAWLCTGMSVESVGIASQVWLDTYESPIELLEVPAFTRSYKWAHVFKAGGLSIFQLPHQMVAVIPPLPNPHPDFYDELFDYLQRQCGQENKTHK